jgi:acyl dehydratase
MARRSALIEPEDDAGLEGDVVGTQLGVTGWYEITQDRVNMFAVATEDRQWIHIEPVRSAAGPFGGPVAHGYLTLSLATVLIADVLVVDELSAILNYGLNKVRFPSPVPVGGRLRGVVTLSGASERSAGIEAVFTIVYELDNSERPTCVAEVVAIYR